MLHIFLMTLFTTNGLQLALPTIMKDFDVPVTTVVWIMIAYSVALSGGTLAMGAISTYFDRRTLVVIGLVVDVGLMMVTFLTGNIYIFIVCRFFSALFRVFPWLILQVVGIGGFPVEQRGRAVGFTTLAQGLGLMISLPLTGFFTDVIGWRWLFVAGSVGFVAMVPLVYALIPSLPAEKGGAGTKSFDFAGTALMMTGLITLITSLQLFARGLGGSGVLLLAGVSVTTLVGFLWVELHTKMPVLDFSLFKSAEVTLAASQSIFVGFGIGSFLVLLPFLFQEGIGWTGAYRRGVLLFQNLTRPVAGPVSGRLADRFGSFAILFPAVIVSVIGQTVLAFVGTAPAVALVVGALIFWGTGQAALQTVNLRQIYTALPHDRLHLAPSINLVLSTLGTISGQAIGSLVVQHSEGQAPADLVSGISQAILAISVFFFVGMVLTQILPRLLLRRGAVASSAAVEV
jgi:DHA2 family multidrug resistance protein-like MFS transporter